MSVEILKNLKKAVLEYDAAGAVSWARKAIGEGVDPVKAMDALTGGIRQVGDGYGRGELFLPELVGAAEVIQSAMPILQEQIEKVGKKQKTLGTVVIGTVYGDIHSIGKTMVATLLVAAGFEVKDSGLNVAAEQFIEAVKKYEADILAMSSLMTTTAPEQEKVINELRKRGLRDKVKVMVGGSAITKEFAEMIGADGYEATAPDAVGLAKRLIGLG